MKGPFRNPTTGNELRDHVTATYLNLRVGLALIAAAFPLVLWFGGSLILGIELLPSLSDYYHTPLRDVFVGTLCAVGVFLYLYKGIGNRENYALNIAGMLIIAVALFPTKPAGVPSSLVSVHGVSAVSFFLAIAYVCLFHASDTIELIRKPERSRLYARTYRVLGILMIGSPLLAYVISVFQDPTSRSSYVFFVELVGVWVFAAYWAIKSLEVTETHAELLALEGRLRSDPSGKVRDVADAARPAAPASAVPVAQEPAG